jgi:hypothetical protein
MEVARQLKYLGITPIVLWVQNQPLSQVGDPGVASESLFPLARTRRRNLSAREMLATLSQPSMLLSKRAQGTRTKR